MGDPYRDRGYAPPRGNRYSTQEEFDRREREDYRRYQPVAQPPYDDPVPYYPERGPGPYRRDPFLSEERISAAAPAPYRAAEDPSYRRRETYEDDYYNTDRSHPNYGRSRVPPPGQLPPDPAFDRQQYYERRPTYDPISPAVQVPRGADYRAAPLPMRGDPDFEEYENRYQPPRDTYASDRYYEHDGPSRERRNPPSGFISYDNETHRRRIRDVGRDPITNLPPIRREGYHEWKLPADGIRKEVLQTDLCLHLGGDATMRGPIDSPEGPVYMYSAYRQLTSEQIRDLKAKTQRLETSRYHPRRGDELIRT